LMAFGSAGEARKRGERKGGDFQRKKKRLVAQAQSARRRARTGKIATWDKRRGGGGGRGGVRKVPTKKRTREKARAAKKTKATKISNTESGASRGMAGAGAARGSPKT
jgi:hypothetical protein